VLRRIALPVLMWSISAAGAEEPPADQPFEVPASVSFIGPERIESEEPQSIGDLLEELPNVEVVSGPRRIGETANIRGFDEERIVTTVDGARQNFNIGHQGRVFIEPDLLKQVEVYRAPTRRSTAAAPSAGSSPSPPRTRAICSTRASASGPGSRADFRT
jgi:outer membrane receptor protein involved in Fe transport